ncbi:MAG: histone deacetylase family protein, partial [Pseudomonadales bacterium]|nr:histone deacetylase family protein [Pseudomonadales bacterium]
KKELYRVHRRDYVDQIFCNAPKRGVEVLGEDVLANPYTLKAAMRASGAVVSAVDVVMKGKVDNAFCAVRPPGHHAERGKAMGFCVFNNVAVGAAYALEVYGLERVAVVDFDVHHGNGTEDTLHVDSRVLFCSSYQHPYYPFTVADSSRSNVVHTPMHAGTSSDDFKEWVQETWMPKLNHFSPQLLFISAGFDAHQADPLADIHLDERDYRWVTRELKAIADQHCDGKIISVLEGGYDLTALARSACQHIKVLANVL